MKFLTLLLLTPTAALAQQTTCQVSGNQVYCNTVGSPAPTTPLYVPQIKQPDILGAYLQGQAAAAQAAQSAAQTRALQEQAELLQAQREQLEQQQQQQPPPLSPEATVLLNALVQMRHCNETASPYGSGIGADKAAALGCAQNLTRNDPQLAHVAQDFRSGRLLPAFNELIGRIGNSAGTEKASSDADLLMRAGE